MCWSSWLPWKAVFGRLTIYTGAFVVALNLTNLAASFSSWFKECWVPYQKDCRYHTCMFLFGNELQLSGYTWGLQVDYSNIHMVLSTHSTVHIIAPTFLRLNIELILSDFVGHCEPFPCDLFYEETACVTILCNNLVNRKPLYVCTGIILKKDVIWYFLLYHDFCSCRIALDLRRTVWFDRFWTPWALNNVLFILFFTNNRTWLLLFHFSLPMICCTVQQRFQ